MLYLHADASKSAQALTDCHLLTELNSVVKMLQCCHKLDSVYTDVNELDFAWLCKNANHYHWAAYYAAQIIIETSYRFGKLSPFYSEVNNLRVCVPSNLPYVDFIQPPSNVYSRGLTDSTCSICANRTYYAKAFDESLWSMRQPPGWHTRLRATLLDRELSGEGLCSEQLAGPSSANVAGSVVSINATGSNTGTLPRVDGQADNAPVPEQGPA